MAISQVRVQFNGQWYALTYNSETKQYEGQIVPPASSHSQSGGYYGLTVEASNDSGGASTLNAANFPALRLVVRETTEPTLALVSPGEGYLTTNSPTLVFTASDEEDGSGVDLGTLSILLDGTEAVPHSTSVISGGYQITCALSGLSDGAHTVLAAVSDYDGNRADLSVSYVVDTAPPELSVRLPNAHRVVDEDTAVVAGDALDVTAPPVTVKITCKGVDQGAVTLGESGAFFKAVPLQVGVNDIVITATDAAGLVSTKTVRMFRMVTDRTQADMDKLAELLARRPWTAAELEQFNEASDRGAYDFTDLNRVTAAMEYLVGLFTSDGYQVGYIPVYPAVGRTVWRESDQPYASLMAGYLANVERLRNVIAAEVPETPEDLEGMHFEEANDIEKILVGIDAVHQYADASYWYSGEIICGEV